MLFAAVLSVGLCSKKHAADNVNLTSADQNGCCFFVENVPEDQGVASRTRCSMVYLRYGLVGAQPGLV